MFEECDAVLVSRIAELERVEVGGGGRAGPCLGGAG